MVVWHFSCLGGSWSLQLITIWYIIF